MNWKGTTIPTTGTEILELQPFLKYLADCIRTKKETTEPINAQDFGKEILKISGGAKLNIEYANTPPADTSKLWLNCQEPSGVEVGNYYTTVNQGEYLTHSTTMQSTVNGCCCDLGNGKLGFITNNKFSIYNYLTKEYEITVSISNSNLSSTNFSKKAYLIGDYIYFGGRGGTSQAYIFRLDINTYEIEQMKAFGTYTATSCEDLLYDKTSNVLYFLTDKMSGSYYYHIFYYNVETNEGGMFFSKAKSSGGASAYIGSYVGAELYNGYIYTFSKYTSGYESFFKYNLETKEKTILQNVVDFFESNNITELKDPLVFGCDNYIYLVANYNTNKMYRFNVVDETIEEYINFPYKLQNCSGCIIDNIVHITGCTCGLSPNVYIHCTLNINQELEENKVVITTDTLYNNNVKLIASDNINLSANIHNAYIGNADNLAEKVNAYYHDSKAWLGINTSNPFTWKTVEEQNVFLGETITLEVPLTNNFGWEMTYNVISDLEVSNNSNTLTINGGSALGTYPITVTATSNDYNSIYEKTFNVITNNAITWSTIPDQTIALGSSVSIDLANYYTNASYNEPTFNIAIAGGGYTPTLTGSSLHIKNEAGSGTIVVTVKATVNGIEYSTPFNLISTDTTE